MIIRDPSRSMVGFDKIQWAVQKETLSPEMSLEIVRVLNAKKIEWGTNPNKDYQKFSKFSISKTGDIFVMNRDGDDEDRDDDELDDRFLFIGDDAQFIMNLLREFAFKKIENLQMIFGAKELDVRNDKRKKK